MTEFVPNQKQSFRSARPNSPRVVAGSCHGKAAVLKSYDHCSGLYKRTVGRLAISREWWALGALEDSGRAPRRISRPSPWCMVTEFVEGTPLEQLSPELVDSERLVAEAEILLRRLEVAGVVHADLGHDFWADMGRECNLIWTVDERLVALDFAGSVPLLAGRTPWARCCQILRLHDRLLLTKVLHHFGQRLDAHPGWKFPSSLDHRVWDLLHLLGKV